MTEYGFFIAGIIQGSIEGRTVHAQEYRRAIKDILQDHIPGARVYCPFEHHPESLGYDDEKARRVFFDHVQMAAETDCLVTFLPQASMGTAVEMYAAREAGRPVISISPLSDNWTVKFLSDLILPDMEAFREFVASGDFIAFIDSFGKSR